MEERGDLVRCWIEFDLTSHEPAPSPPGTVSLDGGDRAYRFLGRGVGVTGYDQNDCLSLVRDVLTGEKLPPVTRIVTDVDVDALGVAEEVGVPAWRGIWFPRLNAGGPTTGPAQ